MDVMTYALCKGNGGGGSASPFIVTLTPTAQDFSGVMDKTVAEINTAYEAGQEIVFRVYSSATSWNDVRCTIVFNNGSEYPSFNAYIIAPAIGNYMIFAYTGTTDDGTKATYATEVYALTPVS